MAGKTPEGALKREITQYLTSVGAWWDMPVRMGYGRRGVPDILVCHRGSFLAFEVKVPGGKPTKWQEREITAIRAAGGRADVVTSVADVRVWIEAIDRPEYCCPGCKSIDAHASWCPLVL